MRTIFALGPEAPTVPLLQTFDSNFTYDAGDPQGGLDKDLWREAFPWHYSGRYGAPSGPNDLPVTLTKDDGSTTPGRLVPHATGDQIIINRESQYYIREFERSLVSPEVPPCAYINASNNLVLHARRTPANFEDYALGNLDAYDVVSFDVSAKTITVHGRIYDRTQRSDGNEYAKGKYRGFARFLRDELTGDPNLDTSWKKKQHAYAWIVLKVSGKADKWLRYDSIDEAATDPPEAAGGTTTHVLHILDTLNASDFPSGTWNTGDVKIQLKRRMTYVSAMLTTQGTWCQKFHMFEIRMKIPEHVRQFFAIFDWSNYVEAWSDGTNPALSFTSEAKSAEADKIENPGGASLARRFHNLWAPYGGMQNYAANNNLQPILSHPEWDVSDSQQHQSSSDGMGPHDSPYSDTWITLRTYWWGQNNVGKPVNSYEWYLQSPVDSKFRRIAGALCPPHWNDGVLDHKQLFVNLGTYSDFNRTMDFIFDADGVSTVDTDDFFVEIDYIHGFQFVGEQAGGASAPNRAGQYPNGLLPTPNDVTGNTGTGIVQAGGTAGGGDTGTTGTPAFDASVTVALDTPAYLYARSGNRYPLKSRIIKNTEGYGIGVTYGTNIPGASIEGSELVFGSNVDGDYLDGLWLEYFEVSGPGTAPTVGGTVVEPDDPTVPPDPDDPGSGVGDPGGGDGTPTYSISVTNPGPIVEGTTDVPEGRVVFVQLTGESRTGTVVAGSPLNTFTITNIPASYDGQNLRAYVTSGPPDNVVADGGYFVFRAADTMRISSIVVSGGGTQV